MSRAQLSPTERRLRRIVRRAERARAAAQAKKRGDIIRAITAKRLAAEARTAPIISPTSVDAIGALTQAAIDAASGNLQAAAIALGITKVPLWYRIRDCRVPTADGTEPLRAWLDRTWPQGAGGRRSSRFVEVAAVVYVPHEIVGLPRWRLYSLAAHRGVEVGVHVNRVPAVGRVRKRVECQMCKESRTT